MNQWSYVQKEGAGFIVRRPIGGSELSDEDADPVKTRHITSVCLSMFVLIVQHKYCESMLLSWGVENITHWSPLISRCTSTHRCWLQVPHRIHSQHFPAKAWKIPDTYDVHLVLLSILSLGMQAWVLSVLIFLNPQMSCTRSVRRMYFLWFCTQFLLLDELGPVNYAKGEFPGAPWHPHRCDVIFIGEPIRTVPLWIVRRARHSILVLR